MKHLERAIVPSFNYVFPATKASADTEIYLSIFPIRIMFKVLSLEYGPIPARRAQRALEEILAKEVSQETDYPDTVLLSKVISVTIHNKVHFDSPSSAGQGQTLGYLSVPIDAEFNVVDGIQTLSLLKQAVAKNPKLNDEGIAVRLIVNESSSFHSPLNISNLADKKTIVAKAVISEVSVFKALTDTEHSKLPIRSKHLFTLSGVRGGTQALLANHSTVNLIDQIELAIRYWNEVSDCVEDWKRVLQQDVTAGEIRANYIHSNAITLAALGAVGAELVSTHFNEWEVYLKGLRQIDWSRSNPDWQGRIFSGDRILKTLASTQRMTVYLKKHLGLPLKPGEEL